jgi:hypothetical protein
MQRSVAFTGLFVEHCGTPCANHCRFCTIGNQRPDDLSFARFAALMERLDEWRRQHRPADFDLVFDWMRAENWDRETAAAMKQLHRRVMPQIREMLFLGGIDFKPDTQLKAWLAERHSLGTDLIWASLAGNRELHDKWVGRRNDFDFNLKALRLASELGYARGEVLFLTKSTLPRLEPLMDSLDAIPGREWRKVRIVYYRGRGKRMMHERITRDDFRRLPERVLADLQERDSLKTEPEWREWLRAQSSAAVLTTRLFLNVTAANIAALEARPCDEIMDELERRTREVFATLPEASYLSERYGSQESGDERLYPPGELERIWLDRYLQERSLSVERDLTPLTRY